MGRNRVFYGDKQLHKPRCRVPKAISKHNKNLSLLSYTKFLKHTAIVGFNRSHFGFLAVKTVKMWQKLVFKINEKKNTKMVTSKPLLPS